MNKRRSLVIIFFIVLIDLIGFGVVLPHLAFYAKALNASAFEVGLLYSAYSIAQLVFAPLWGSVSDRIGRRSVMLISMSGSVAAYTILGFSQSLRLLFIARLFAGAMAGNIAAAYAFITDITKSNADRVKAMGLIGAAFGIGFMVGPAIGAYLQSQSGRIERFAAYPFFEVALFAAMMSLVSLIFAFAMLEESIDANESAKLDAPPRPRRANIFSIIFWQQLSSANELRNQYIGNFLLALCQASLYGAFPLYCATQLSFTAKQVGVLYAIMGFTAVLVQGGLLRVLVKRVPEKVLFLIGACALSAGYFGCAFSSNFSLLVASLCAMATGGAVCMPILTTFISRQANDQAVGVTFGIAQSMSALGRALGPALGGALFALNFRIPFITSAILVFIMLILILTPNRRS